MNNRRTQDKQRPTGWHYAKLRPDWMLRGWSDQPVVAVNWRTGAEHRLTPDGFYVAQSCDGRTSFEGLAFMPEHRSILAWLVAQGIAETCSKTDPISAWQRYRRAPNPRITGILWSITGGCNLRCLHCFMESPSARFGQLPLATMVRFVEQFARANVLEVTLTGGEPFLRQDILDIIVELAARHLRPSCILTNGILITERHLGEIQRLGLAPQFQISFDGVGAHDQMRGVPGAERATVLAIRRVRAAGFPVAVTTAISRLNLDSLNSTYELIKTLDVKAWRMEAPHANGNWRGANSAATLEEQARALEPLAKRWVHDGQPFEIELCGFFHASRGMMFPKLRDYQSADFDCGACRHKANVLPDGTLVPCPRYVDTPLQQQMPNLLREDLRHAWRRSTCRALIDRRKSEVLAHNPECGDCKWFGQCGMGCRASGLTETGDPLAKDPICCELFKKGYRRRFGKIALINAMNPA
jgi:Fe-coproporphyrin III synthase